MRLIKLVLISFVIFFLVLTAMSLFIPSHVRISRATNLLSPRDSIYHLINDSSEWKNWNPLFQPGAGSPSAQINHRIIEQSDTLTRMEFTSAGKKALNSSWELHRFSASDSVTLQWYLDFHNRWYPWEKFKSLFYEKTYGTMMERGLQNLKGRLEK